MAAENGFRATSERHAGGTSVVSIVGDLDLYTAPEFERTLALNGTANRRVVVDLSRCTFIDIACARHSGQGDPLHWSRCAASRCIRPRGSPGVGGDATRPRLYGSSDPRLGAERSGAMSGWRDKEARNQAVCREVNERIEQLARSFGVEGRDRLICECGNPEYMLQIELTQPDRPSSSGGKR